MSSVSKSIQSIKNCRVRFWICGFKSQPFSIFQLWYLAFHPLILAVSFGLGFLIVWPAGFFPVIINIVGALILTIAAILLGKTKWVETITIPTLLCNLIASTIVFYILFSYFVSVAPDLAGKEFRVIPIWVVSYIIVAELFFYLMFRFVVPVILHRRTSNGSSQSEPPRDVAVNFADFAVPPTPITLGELTVAQTEILMLEAQANYLLVVTKTGESTQREKISTAVDAIDPSLGIQPHRSFWVAFSALSHASKSKGQLSLVLNDGRQVKVARSRLSAVRDILTQHSIPEN